MEPKTETVEVTTSPANSLNKEDTKRWLVNMLRFFLGTMAIYFGFVSQQIDQVGFSWAVFIPSSFIMGVLTKDFMNSLLDLITKYTQEKKYIEGEKVA